MINLVKKFIFSCFIILLLSVTIQNKPIFYHIYPVTKNISEPVQNIVTSSIQSVFSYSKKFSAMIFLNANPKRKDSVSTQSAASKKINQPLDEIYDFERDELENILE